ncbi:MAG: molybdopterin biosynthesis protein [Proteobacteria bacterium]|nr:molybdopterin biosynthesis protein [Pseudomonadota bacterium]MBU4472122.1 molybdopterin biosynthesis protein [Pseudomonadota bacterium]MCG2752879.1 molybdopterin biosynthesis protein [Desulfobacteraceae bacterium]
MNHTRNVYLKMKTLKEARNILFERFHSFEKQKTETLSVIKAVGRVTAGPVFSKLSCPNFHAAAMDGIAVDASVTFGANESSPKTLIPGKDFRYINTGHVMPENTNAVIMIENIQVQDQGHVIIEAPVFPWQNVRKMGEDIVATELLFPRHHKITPYSLGALLAAGIFEIPVLEKIRIFIIPTGSELVDPESAAKTNLIPGQVIESNSFVLESLAEACGGNCVRHKRVMDDAEKIADAVREALAADFDMVMILGGSSAGSEDYGKIVISRLGDVLVHGVTMMPGKPVILGAVEDKPVFGIPGYPVSAIIAFEQLVRPLICRMQGLMDEPRTTVSVFPTRKIPSKLGTEEFLRVKLGKVGDRIVATPLPRGAGSITSITEADGIIRIPNHVEGLAENSPVAAELLRPVSSIENTIVCVGSHDNTLDVLADHIRIQYDHITLSSSHVGSMGGLMAIKKGVCHMAGTHLLDPESDGYNISYIQKYLQDIPVVLVNLVFRDQGLIIRKNNPKNIKGIEDLKRNDVQFINRQGGSGTRILLDYRLKQTGIAADEINGYENEEFTHMSVAVTVLSGAADAGLGIYAAAKALDLDFIPVVTEQYDLVIPEAFVELPPIRILLETAASPSFKKRVATLGGYHTHLTGERVWRSGGAGQ